jgi:hypothetical protein
MAEEMLPAFEDTEEIPSANQSEMLPAFEDTEELSAIPSQKSSVPSEVKGAGIGALVGAVPGLTAEVSGVISEAAAKKMSPYTPEQLQLLSSEYKKFKTITPKETMAKVGEQFSKQNRVINELEKEAYANLSEPIARQEYQQAVVRSSMPFTREVDVTTPEFLKTAEQAAPKLQTINPIAKQEADQLEKFAVKKASEIVQNKRNSSLGTIPEEQLLQEYNVLKEQIKQTKEGFTFKPNMEKAIQDYNKELEESASMKELGKKTAMEKLESPLAKQFPELKGRLYSSAFADVEKDVVNILDKYKPGETLKGEDAYKLVRDIRQAVFAKDGTLKLGEDAAKAAQRAIRDLVGSKNPEASNLFQEMSQKISDLKKLEKTGYMKRDTKLSKEAPEFIQFGQKEQKKIIQDIAPNLYKSGIDVSGDVASRLGELKKTLPDDLYKELELAVLKIAMEDPKKAATMSSFDVALATVSPQFAGSKFLAKAISSPTGSLQAYRAGKALQKIAKPLGTVGAIAGGVLGGPLGAFAGEVAQEALDVEPSGALPTTISTDVQGQPFAPFYEEKGFTPEEAVKRAEISQFQEEYGTQPKTIQQEYPTNLALEGMSDIVESPQITSQRQSLQKQKQMLEESRRLRDERRLETQKVKQLGALAPTYVEAPLKQVLKADNPAEIASIAQSMQASPDRASQEYSRVLSQIVDAPASQKEAVLFGLNQQPAFREILKKLRGE